MVSVKDTISATPTNTHTTNTHTTNTHTHTHNKHTCLLDDRENRTCLHFFYPSDVCVCVGNGDHGPPPWGSHGGHMGAEALCDPQLVL